MTNRMLFIFGSLLDPALREVVLGRPKPARPAELADHRVMRVAGEVFPIALPTPGARVNGALLDLDEAEFDRVVFFEDECDFALSDVEVTVDGRREVVEMFTSDLPAADEPWDLETWMRGDQPFFLECAREIMELYERGADWSDPTLWPGVKARARARINAATEPPRKGLAGLSRDAVRTSRIDRPYASFFAVEEHFVRHPRFDGGETPELRRTVFATGDAVTVVPYDPVRDAVLLIAQWRAGPHARGDSDPWPVEAVAGRIDGPETPEETARREAREEAGLDLGRMAKVAAFYPSPGALAEFVTAFVGEADLSAAGGVHGAPGEDEDILSFVVPLEKALDMVESFEANTSPIVITLLWLALKRDSLRAEWTG